MQGALVPAAAGEEDAPAAPAAATQPWPPSMAAQAAAVRAVLAGASAPLTAAQVAGSFASADRPRVEELLATLAALGQARLEGERYVA